MTKRSRLASRRLGLEICGLEDFPLYARWRLGRGLRPRGRFGTDERELFTGVMNQLSVVADRSMIAAGTIELLTRHLKAPFDYIPGCRMPRQREVSEQALSRADRHEDEARVEISWPDLMRDLVQAEDTR